MVFLSLEAPHISALQYFLAFFGFDLHDMLPLVVLFLCIIFFASLIGLCWDVSLVIVDLSHELVCDIIFI